MRRVLVVAALLFALGVGVRGVAGTTGAEKSFAAANDAWELGDYIPALNGYIALLNAPGGETLLEPIALTTGELFETRELTTDGRAPRFSPDGRFLVYETGLETSRRTKILKNDAPRAEVADLAGVSATFSPQMTQVAYLKIPDNDEIRRASDALDRASLTARNRAQLTQTLTWLIAKHATIVVRDLNNGREMILPTPDLLKAGLTFSADGRSLYFLGGAEGEPDRNDLYVISEASPKPVLVVDAAGLKGVPTVDPSGAALLYVQVTPAQNPLREPAGGAGRAGGAGAADGAGGGRGAQATFGVVDLATHTVNVINGSAPALSGDGKTLAYIARAGGEYRLMVGRTLGAQAPVKQTTERLDAPALSPDGSRVAYQKMPRDDWEIFVASRDGKDEQRVTREIQHDILPRFIGNDRLLGLIGEPRHRRSYLYDLRTLTRTRIFHNNTVRTIAPEYQWAVSPDGTKLLIGAERDGNTVTPDRGVYLVELEQKVTKAEVLSRLRANLKSEMALKAAGTAAFQPIAADVRRVVNDASVTRVFDYEKALFDFDSKNLTQPGNRKASEFLFNTYSSFGYTPEYQWFEPRNAFGGKTANVVATLRGTENPDLVYVVSSHYDSVEAGPGADDDTSGTAALLEAARVMAAHPMPATIVFASMTGEEGGLLGSREFARRAVESKMHVTGVLNNDMIGWMNDQRMDNTIRYSNPGIRDIQHAAAFLFTKLITYDALYWKGTDAASFYDVYGDIIGGIGSYPVLGSPHYHQSTDLLEHENHQLITETSKTTVATIMLMASSPSRLTGLKVESDAGQTATLSWTPSPEKGVTSYAVATGPASDPLRHRVTVTEPRATLAHVAPGTVVSVKAVNARGLGGWDWARAEIKK
ncbi:MAG: M20/M25/M40 family metallo-hydrolase [Acidobacteriia bacterium]|nr:M20/M25/M40 family metallo-hydrolase [Terriglobia bacterium]